MTSWARKSPFGLCVCTLEPGGMRTDWAAEAKREAVDMLTPAMIVVPRCGT